VSEQGSSAGPWPAGVGFYGLLGAVLIVIGGFLPWLSGNGRTVSAWNIHIMALIPKGGSGGVMTGVLLLTAAVVLVPYVVRRRLPTAVRVIPALIAINTAGAALVAGLRIDPRISPGLGLLLTLAGGVLMIMGEAGIGRVQGVDQVVDRA
jgi:hypothetical protein